MAQLSTDAFAFGADLMRVEEALALVIGRIPPIAETERVHIADADRRVLVRSVSAPIDLPVFDNSAVDGYAVAYADLDAQGATRLPVAGRITAGQIVDYQGVPGIAVRIFTGAAMPPGTDTVFMQEDVRLLDDGRVELPPGLARGANRRAKGEDIARGDAALTASRAWVVAPGGAAPAARGSVLDRQRAPRARHTVAPRRNL